MPRHPQPPLHELLQHVQQDDEVWLPAVLQSGRMGWIYRTAQSLESVHLFLYVLIGLGTLMAFWLAWWLAVALALAAAMAAWHRGWKNPAQDHDLPLEWNGWRIDMPQRSLARIGVLPDEAAQAMDSLRLEPADAWSVGVVMGDYQTSQYVYAWRIELRHRSRGPVAMLCAVRSTSGAKAVMQDIDALVDALTQRLGIRRTGSRLLRLARGENG